MSNFKCIKCGMTNIDCGRQGYKTPCEIKLEKENNQLRTKLNECIKVLKKLVHCCTIGRCVILCTFNGESPVDLVCVAEKLLNRMKENDNA